jgi:hypothetical protein
MTAPLTPRPGPVRRNTSTTSATVFTVSPHREMVWAANKRRVAGLGEHRSQPWLLGGGHAPILLTGGWRLVRRPGTVSLRIGTDPDSHKQGNREHEAVTGIRSGFLACAETPGVIHPPETPRAAANPSRLCQSAPRGRSRNRAADPASQRSFAAQHILPARAARLRARPCPARTPDRREGHHSPRSSPGRPALPVHRTREELHEPDHRHRHRPSRR